MSDAQDHYETLQVHHHAEPEVTSAAYRRLSQMYHPDVNKTPEAQERMTEINLGVLTFRFSDPKWVSLGTKSGETGGSLQFS